MGPSNHLSFEPGDLASTHACVPALWEALAPELEKQREHADDLARLRGVLEDRRQSTRNFFDSVAGDWNAIGVDFETGQARQRVAANFIAPELVLADLGCGTGYMAQALLGLCARVICVDSSSGMLEEARKRLDEMPIGTRVDYRQGELDKLPIDDGEVDGVACAMVLHHLETPAACLAEMRRIIRPGGTAVILELAPHKQEWMHESLGDRHLGLDSQDVARHMEAAGFEQVTLEVAADRYQPRSEQEAEASPGLPLYLIRGRVPRLS